MAYIAPHIGAPNTLKEYFPKYFQSKDSAYYPFENCPLNVLAARGKRQGTIIPGHYAN